MMIVLLLVEVLLMIRLGEVRMIEFGLIVLLLLIVMLLLVSVVVLFLFMIGGVCSNVFVVMFSVRLLVVLE